MMIRRIKNGNIIFYLVEVPLNQHAVQK